MESPQLRQSHRLYENRSEEPENRMTISNVLQGQGCHDNRAHSSTAPSPFPPSPSPPPQFSCSHGQWCLNIDDKTSSRLSSKKPGKCLQDKEQLVHLEGGLGLSDSLICPSTETARHKVQKAARDRAGPESQRGNKPGLVVRLPLSLNQKLASSRLTLYFSFWLGGSF
jgi:hypothetical protein